MWFALNSNGTLSKIDLVRIGCLVVLIWLSKELKTIISNVNAITSSAQIESSVRFVFNSSTRRSFSLSFAVGIAISCTMDSLRGVIVG